MLSESTVYTPSGVWDPLAWVLAMLLTTLLAYLIYYMGEKRCKRGEQTQPFISGNPAEEEKLHVSTSNLYWGFTTTLEDYYNTILRMHNGVLTDYFAYFIATLTVLFIIITYGGA